jgi:hypothetical protein
MDIGDRSKVNSQQSSHVITKPSQTVTKKPDPVSPAQTAREKRIKFERRMKFNIGLGMGKSPTKAAEDAGYEAKPGERMKSTDIMNLQYRGTLPKQKKRR